jgi:hypothetical protein
MQIVFRDFSHQQSLSQRKVILVAGLSLGFPRILSISGIPWLSGIPSFSAIPENNPSKGIISRWEIDSKCLKKGFFVVDNFNPTLNLIESCLQPGFCFSTCHLL